MAVRAGTAQRVTPARVPSLRLLPGAVRAHVHAHRAVVTTTLRPDLGGAWRAGPTGLLPPPSPAPLCWDNASLHRGPEAAVPGTGGEGVLSPPPCWGVGGTRGHSQLGVRR